MRSLEERLKHREEQKRWRLANPDKYRESLRKWRAKNPHKSLLYRRTFKGYFSDAYHRILWRCNGGDERYTGMLFMSRDEWREFLEETIEDRKVLYDEWVATGYRVRISPSIDRIDSTQGYVVGNCRWLPQWENSRLGGKAGK